MTLLGLFSLKTEAQVNTFPLQQDYIEETRKAYSSLDSLVHLDILPFSIDNTEISDNYFYRDTAKYYSTFKAKIFKDDLFKVEELDVRFTINPLFDFRAGIELKDTSQYADTTQFYQNSRGFKVDGKIGSRFYFHTSFIENQSFLPSWLKNWTDSTGVIPGSGRHKAFNQEGFDYAHSSGWISYFPSKNVNLFFGHAKMFSGFGYRSHLLSHQSFNYPHLKGEVKLAHGRLKLMWALAALQSLQRQPLGEVPESLFKRKAATFSSVSYIISKRIQVSVFEANVWRRYDETAGSIDLNARAFVPVPAFGYLSYSGSENQSRRIGFNALLKVSDRIQSYGQYVIKENAIQLGLRANDVFLKGLRIQAEYNQLRDPRTDQELVEFTHFNESLAHPVMEEFAEFYGRLMYRKSRWNGSVTFSLINSSNDRLTIQSKVGYLVNPKTNFNIQIGIIHRSHENQPELDSQFFQFGFRTSFFDSLFDF